MLYNVTDKKTGELLGQIEKYRMESPGWNGRGMRPSRVWFRLYGRPDINADTKSNIACYLAGSRKYQITEA